MNFKFNIGDKVVIVHKGKTYSTYSDKFVELGFKNVVRNPALPEGTVGTVFGTSFDTSERKIYAIRTKNGEEVLIGGAGIEVVHLEDDNYEVSGAFILEAYKAACPEWKKKLEAKFPELFFKVKFKKGDVVKSDSGTILTVLEDVESMDESFEGIVFESLSYQKGHISVDWSVVSFEKHEVKF